MKRKELFRRFYCEYLLSHTGHSTLPPPSDPRFIELDERAWDYANERLRAT